MFLNVMTTASNQLGPDSRYCLVRFALRFDVAESGGLSTKDMAKEFGVSESVMSVSLSSLVESGALTCRSEVKGKKGRASRFYRVSTEWSKGSSQCCHAQLIAELLRLPRESRERVAVIYPQREGENDLLARARARARVARGARDGERLSNVNRLILALLLYSADRLGVVRTLGRADLSKLTGLTSERLNHRIKTLLSCGFIRAYVPGATSAVLFRPTKSFYFLNLNHPLLVGTHHLTTSIVFPHPWEGDMEGDAVQKFHAAQAKDDRFLRFFNDKHRKPISRLLQGRIDEYASYFLSANWAGVDSTPHKRNLDLLQKVRSDFQSPQSMMENDTNSLDDEEDIESFIESLYSTALRKARRVKKAMLLVKDVDYRSMGHRILPSPTIMNGSLPVYPSVSVLSAPNALSEKNSCYIVDMVESEIYSFSSEPEILIEDRYFYGLLTAPEGRLILESVDGMPKVLRRLWIGG